MILRPVRPASPCGPPISNRPVGLTRYLAPFSMVAGSTGLITSSITASASSAWFAFEVGEGGRGLGIGWRPRRGAILPPLARARDKPMRVVDREGHQRGRFIARVAEHQALVARPLVEVVVGRLVDAALDVGRLP